MRIRTKVATKPGRPKQEDSFNVPDTLRKQVESQVSKIRNLTTSKSVVEEALRIGLAEIAKRG